MNPKQLVKLSNTIGVISILLLIYWVFIFISIQVFGLKVFRENMTETFYLSVLGILALMAGALIINVMFNLTRIAERHNQDGVVSKTGTRLGFLFLISLPIVFLSLFAGDHLSAKKKEKFLVRSAKSIIETNESKSNHLLNYSFDETWIIRTKDILDILTKTDDNLPYVAILVQDAIEQDPVILGFSHYYSGNLNDTIQPLKKRFIRKTTQPERAYLDSVFKGNNTSYRYSAHDGRYELFYPYVKEDKRVVLYFSDRQRYGKIGS